MLVFWPPPRHIRSRTHSAGPGTGPAALRARDATDPVAPQQGLLCLLPQSPIGEPATRAGAARGSPLGGAQPADSQWPGGRGADPAVSMATPQPSGGAALSREGPAAGRGGDPEVPARPPACAGWLLRRRWEIPVPPLPPGLPLPDPPWTVRGRLAPGACGAGPPLPRARLRRAPVASIPGLVPLPDGGRRRLLPGPRSPTVDPGASTQDFNPRPRSPPWSPEPPPGTPIPDPLLGGRLPLPLLSPPSPNPRPWRGTSALGGPEMPARAPRKRRQLHLCPQNTGKGNRKSSGRKQSS